MNTLSLGAKSIKCNVVISFEVLEVNLPETKNEQYLSIVIKRGKQ